MEDSLPWSGRWRDGRARKEHDIRITMAAAKPLQIDRLDAAECVLVDDDETHRAASWRYRIDETRFTNAAGANRVIPSLAQSGPKQRARPLVGHDQQDSWRDDDAPFPGRDRAHAATAA